MQRNNIKFNLILAIVFLVAISFVHSALIPESSDSSPKKIVGGDLVDIEDVPYQVALFLRNGFKCGGVIIDKHFVITAAHCIGINVNSTEDFFIRVGSRIRNADGFVYNISEIIVHDQFNSKTYEYDAALLRIEEEIEYPAIPIIDQDEDVAVGERLLVSGWGFTQVVEDDQYQLRAVTVQKMDHAECINQLSSVSKTNVTESMLCAGIPVVGGKDACNGDSGGPLVTLDTDPRMLAGLVSWGYNCARPNIPGIYTRIASISTWIRDTIAEDRLAQIRGL